jgi:hypothetical protein
MGQTSSGSRQKLPDDPRPSLLVLPFVPRDVLCVIFQFLPDEDLFSVLFVNHAWHHAVLHFISQVVGAERRKRIKSLGQKLRAFDRQLCPGHSPSERFQTFEFPTQDNDQVFFTYRSKTGKFFNHLLIGQLTLSRVGVTTSWECIVDLDLEISMDYPKKLRVRFLETHTVTWILRSDGLEFSPLKSNRAVSVNGKKSKVVTLVWPAKATFPDPTDMQKGLTRWAAVSMIVFFRQNWALFIDSLELEF